MKKSNEPNPLPHINKISWQKWLYPHEVEQINQFYDNLKKERKLYKEFYGKTKSKKNNKGR